MKKLSRKLVWLLLIVFVFTVGSGFSVRRSAALPGAGEQLSGFASGGVAGALGSIGAAAETAGRAMTLGVTAPLMTAAGAAIQTGMQFDASMSNVYGLMSSLNLSQAQMDANV